jgi:hypothetical protein
MRSLKQTYQSLINAVAQLHNGMIMTSFIFTTTTITTPLRGL